MKRLIITTLVAFAAMFFVSCSAQRRDVYLTYEQLSADAPLKQFKKANKANQIEILNILVDRANKEYLNCQTIDDLHEVQEQLELIKFYNNVAKQKSIAVTNAIRKLDNQIKETEEEYKKKTIIDATRNQTYYQDKGQDY